MSQPGLVARCLNFFAGSTSHTSIFARGLMLPDSWPSFASVLEPFRYRLRDGKVIIHDVIHGGTTVLLPNETFTLAYFDYHQNFEKFIGEAERSVSEALSGDGAFRPDTSDDRIHFTSLPWISFTSFSHARNWGREDSVPKIAFGKFTKDNQRTLLPISVEVHHALV